VLRLRPRRWVGPAGVTLVVVVVATVCVLPALGFVDATMASSLASVATIVAAFITIAEKRAKSVSNDQLLVTAQKLARDVRDQEAGVLTRLMADSGDPKPADVSFAQPAKIYWRTDGDNRQGTLNEVKEFYQSLGRGRLVVRGEPGAGKTVLAIKLVLDLAAAVQTIADGTCALPRVPVRLSLPAFDPGDDSDNVEPEVLSDRLNGWLIRHLKTAFGLPGNVATALVTNGWILLVLDGLDEMDLDDAEPRRAASVIRALNHSLGGAVPPVVITCRTSRYQQLSGHFGSAGKISPAGQNSTSIKVIQDATVVDVKPLTSQSVVAYLTHRFRDPVDQDHIESRWRPIVERLTASNNSGDSLVAALGSPLRLFLTVTAYSHPTSAPIELTELATAAEFDEHLFARLVPAVLEQHRPPARQQYTAADVTRWLTTMARHLAWQGQHGDSSSDLRLDLLWSAAGWRAPRYAAMAAIATVAGALLAVGVLVTWPPDVLPVLGMVMFIGIAAWMARRPTIDLQRFTLSGLRTSAGRRRIGRLLMVGCTAGLVGGLMVAPVSSAVGLLDQLRLTLRFSVLGLVGALVIGLGSGPASRPTVIDRPTRLVRQGAFHAISAVMAFSLILVSVGKVGNGLSAGLVGQLVAGLAAFLAFGLAVGFLGGLAVALAIGLNSNVNHSGGLPFLVVAFVIGLIFAANSPWPRYLFAVMLLARRGKLPRRPAVFLDWAYQAGLMRLSGIAVQFRHREFQTWLAICGRRYDSSETALEEPVEIR
jgi:hypothetical protein